MRVGVLIALLSVLVTYSGRVDGPVDLNHEGERTAHLDTLARGGLPFRDVYLPHGLGENVLKPLAARRLFGDSLGSQRRLGQNSFIYRGLLPPLGVVALILAVAAISRSALCAAIALGLAALGLFEVTERHALGMAAVACLGVHLRSRRPGWLVAAGALAALASIYSLEVGLYVVASGLAWLACDAWITGRDRGSWPSLAVRRWAALAGGFVVGAAPLVLWGAWNGVLGDIAANLHIQLFLRNALFPMSYPPVAFASQATPLENVLGAGSTLLLFYVMPLLYAAALAWALAARGDATRRSALVLASWVGAAFYASVWGRPDVWHVAFAGAGFVLFAAVAFDVLRRDAAAPVRVAGLVALGAVAGASLWVGQLGVLGASRLGHEAATVPASLRSSGRAERPSSIARLAGVRIPADQADYLEAVVGYLRAHTSPEDTFLDLTNQAALHYLAERRPPTRFALLSYAGTPELRAQMVREIERRGPPPRLVVVDLRRPLSRDALGQYVVRHYRPDRQIGSVGILRRSE